MNPTHSASFQHPDVLLFLATRKVVRYLCFCHTTKPTLPQTLPFEHETMRGIAALVVLCANVGVHANTPTCSSTEQQQCADKGHACCVQWYDTERKPTCYNTSSATCCVGGDEVQNPVCPWATSYCDTYHTEYYDGGCVPGKTITCTATSQGNCKDGESCCIQSDPKYKQDNPVCYDASEEICCESNGPRIDMQGNRGYYNYKIETCNATTQRCDPMCGCMTKDTSVSCCKHWTGANREEITRHETMSQCTADQTCSGDCGCVDAGEHCCVWNKTNSTKVTDQRADTCSNDVPCSNECGCKPEGTKCDNVCGAIEPNQGCCFQEGSWFQFKGTVYDLNTQTCCMKGNHRGDKICNTKDAVCCKTDYDAYCCTAGQTCSHGRCADPPAE